MNNHDSTTLIDDGSSEESLTQYLTSEELALMDALSEADFDRYLAACASAEARTVYLADPTAPEAARQLLATSNWR